MLEAHNLTVQFGKKIILKEVSLTIKPNQRTVIIGPNGSGKTTLLRALAGRFPYLYKNLLLDGVAYETLSSRQLARAIALVSQSDNMDMRLRVRDYVALGQIPYRGYHTQQQQKQIIDNALLQTNLQSLADLSIATLSGGQTQRVIIARALAQQPKMLMLDEPTNHLDPRARSDILQTVKQQQITTVTILHDFSLIPAFAQRLIVMNHGAIVADGSIDEVLTNSLLNEVFGMSCFTFPHPKTGKPFMAFEPCA